MKRPTRRSLVLLGVGALLVLAGSTAQAGWLFVLAAGVVGTLGASLIVAHGTSGLVVERDLPAFVTVGDGVGVRLTVTNDGRRSSGLVRVTDHFEGLANAILMLDGIQPGGRATARVTREALQRGVYSGAESVFETGPPFGFLLSKRKVRSGASLTVRPATVSLGRFPLIASSSAPSSDLRDRPRAGMGDEFLGVRQYRAGDPMRSIHWRSTARTGQLVVREYEETAQERCRIVLGGPDFGAGPKSAFETVVSAAGSIALYAIAHRHPLELARVDPSGRIERLVQPSADDVLAWLASAQASDAAIDPLLTESASLASDTTVLVVSAPEVIPRSLPSVPMVAVVGRPSTWSDEAADDDPVAVRARLPRSAELRLLEKEEPLTRCLHG